MSKRTIIMIAVGVILIVILVLTAAIMIFGKNQTPLGEGDGGMQINTEKSGTTVLEEQQINQPVSSQTFNFDISDFENIDIDTSDWKTYRNEELKFEVRVPINMIVKKTSLNEVSLYSPPLIPMLGETNLYMYFSRAFDQAIYPNCISVDTLGLRYPEIIYSIEQSLNNKSYEIHFCLHKIVGDPPYSNLEFVSTTPKSNWIIGITTLDDGRSNYQSIPLQQGKYYEAILASMKILN